MTTALTHRNRDSLTLTDVGNALRAWGYDVCDDYPTSPGTCIARLNLAGWQETLLFGDEDLPWSSLYSHTTELVEFTPDLDAAAITAAGQRRAREIAQHALAETMTVTVRDRAAESSWGSGMTSPRTREVTVSAFCSTCGEHRGEPTGQNQHDDGAWYWVQVWDNPCGHTDYYERVIVEANALSLAAGAPRWEATR